MSVIEALRRTQKGQLKYTKQLDIGKLKNDLNHLSPPPLSRCHEEKESSKQNLSFGLKLDSVPSPRKDYNENSCLSWTDNDANQDRVNNLTYLNAIHEEKSDASKEDAANFSDLQMATPVTGVVDKTSQRQTASCPVSPEFGLTSCAVHEANKMWDSYAQLSMAERRAQFEDHDRALTFLIKHKWKEIKYKLEQQSDYRQSQIEKKLQESQEETNKTLQRLRKDHEDHHKKINTKHKELEKHREMLEQEERKREQQKHAEKLKALEDLFKQIDDAQKSFIGLQDGFEHKAQLHEHVGKYRMVLEKVYAGFAAQMQAARQASSIPDELIVKFKEQKDKSLHAVDFLKKQIEETRAKVEAQDAKQKEEEKQKAEEQQKAAEAKKQEESAAGDFAVQALAYVLKEKDAKSKRLAEVESKLQSFISNAQMKKYRFDLQRAVNTPINAISGISGPHLLDKLGRLRALLSGQMVEVAGKHVSVNDAPEGPLFCQNLVAKMLVKKGEEQVTSKHESAFAIAAVAVAIWTEFPTVGELFMCHLQALCPYILPYYATRQQGQSKEDYYKSLGYKVAEDGTLEEQDKFLRRMSGLMRLYSACMVATLPNRGSNVEHPQGLQHAWMWLARVMNMEPHPDITAALIHDVLSVTGHALFKEYSLQFVKLLYLLYKVYLPKLQSVSVTNATVGRLQLFLEKATQTAKIPPPEGLLPPDFWTSS